MKKEIFKTVIFLLLLITSILLKWYVNDLFWISTILLSIFYSLRYLFFGFLIFNNIKIRNIFKKESYSNFTLKKTIFSVVTGFSIFTIILGVGFGVQKWPGALFCSITGSFLLLNTLIVLRFRAKKNRTEDFKYLNIILFIYFLIGLLNLTSLTITIIDKDNNPENNSVTDILNSKFIKQTIGISENDWLTKSGKSNIDKKFQYKGYNQDELKRNVTIDYFISYKNEMKEIMRYCNLHIEPANEQCHISKINNYHFKIFIDSTFNVGVLSMRFSISPKKNFLLEDKDFNKHYGSLPKELQLKEPKYFSENEKMVLFIKSDMVERDKN